MRKSLREVFYRVGGDFSAYLSVWPLLRLPDRRETRRSVPLESESNPGTTNGRRISCWISDGRSADRTRCLSSWYGRMLWAPPTLSYLCSRQYENQQI